MSDLKNNLVEELKLDIEALQNALKVLTHSYEQCRAFGLKQAYTLDELDKLEAFTARFSRTTDIATKKIVNAIMIYKQGEVGSMKDKAAFCEKYNFVDQGDDFINMRLTRNFIAHEYASQDTNKVFKEVWDYYPGLINFANKIASHCLEKVF